MFVDMAKILVKSGDGGNGAVSFRREKFVPHGGPDGGDGGRGGNIIIKADSSMRTLLDFKYKKRYIAENGMNGHGKRMTGRDGEDLIIKLPLGTVVKSSESGIVIVDLMEEGQTKVVVRGGRGGKGNAKFATPTRKAPRFAQEGEKGNDIWLTLELKSIADVGLIGFPNVGKSTILSVLTSAQPKIANYHFTTLKPNLGVVKMSGGRSFIMADIPGLIEGAHEGVGLGHDFLRHIERTRMLVHVIDISGMEGRNPISDYEKINNEMKAYSNNLSDKKQIVVANKMDMPNADENFMALRKYLLKEGIKCFQVSAIQRKGFEPLLEAIWELLDAIPVIEPYVEADEEEYIVKEDKSHYEIEIEGDIFIVKGPFIEELMGRVNLEDYDSLQYFQMSMRQRGIIDELRERGIKDGDTVRVDDFEFDYIQ
ncbi:MAG: GTPase ObgE [Clostridiales bacterium]|nr:GTPase ObgE [Clostridiales bacterium]